MPVTPLSSVYLRYVFGNKMSAPSNELNVAKRNLSDALGDHMKLYVQILKSWFKQKLSREEFDMEARKLLTVDTVHLHNEFLLAVLTKCQTLGSSMVSKPTHSSSHSVHGTSTKPVKKSKRKIPHSTRSHFQKRFAPQNPLSHVRQASPEPEEKAQGFASRDLALPDIGLVHGRMIVSAWDYGLEDVEDDAVRIVMQAVQIELKNILTAILARRKAYKVREGKFRYAMGSQVSKPFLRNALHLHDDSQESEATSISQKGAQIPSLRPSLDTGMRDAAVQLACGGSEAPTKYPVSMFDLFDALQVYKHAIPSHTVYATNMERIINRLWHPSNEELEQDHIHKQEVLIKRQLTVQQSAVRI